jgi:hypothetical protein
LCEELKLSLGIPNKPNTYGWFRVSEPLAEVYPIHLQKCTQACPNP